jgi:hypothetical protein
MLEPYGAARAVTLGIQDALRDGLAHLFETKYLDVQGTRIELVVSWGALEHMSLRREPLGLVLNVKTMWADLRWQFDLVADRLGRERQWAREVPRAWREGPVKPIHGEAAIAAWRNLLASRGWRP